MNPALIRGVGAVPRMQAFRGAVITPANVP